MAGNSELDDNARQTEEDGLDGIDLSGLTAKQLLAALGDKKLDELLEEVPLDRIPKYRSTKSKLDSNYESLRQEKQRVERERQQREEELERLVTSNMTEAERLKYERDKLLSQLEAANERERTRERDEQKRSILSEIMDEVGVPMSAIESAESLHEAWLMAQRWVKKNGSVKDNKKMAAARDEEEDDRDASNATFSGKSSAPIGGLQAKYNKARKNFDMKEMLEVMKQADIAGQKLDEW